MHIYNLDRWKHSHRYVIEDGHSERNTRRVILLTLSMMIIEIRGKIESDSDTRVTDIHIWRVGSHHLSAIDSIVTHYPKSPDHYKKLLADYDEIAHVTVEVNSCDSDPCMVQPEPAR